MNWAVKLRHDGQDEILPGLDEETGKSLLDELNASGFAAELVDMLEPLRTRLPVGRRVRHSTGREGVVVESCSVTGPHRLTAHCVDHVGLEMVCVRLDGRPPTWFVADSVAPSTNKED